MHAKLNLHKNFWGEVTDNCEGFRSDYSVLGKPAQVRSLGMEYHSNMADP